MRVLIFYVDILTHFLFHTGHDFLCIPVSVNDFINHFETKVKQFTDEKRVLEEAECIKLGKKDPDSYPLLTDHNKLL